MAAIGSGSNEGKASRAAALRLVVLFGIVSLFADMVYEGGRSITGPYLAVLGATGAAVGIVAGGGELLGYALRLVSGRLLPGQTARVAVVRSGHRVVVPVRLGRRTGAG